MKSKLTLENPSERIQEYEKNSGVEELRLLTLNVHGWCNEDRTRIIDDEIVNMIELYTPTVLCLQEVKHPFPANAGNHVVRVNSFDKTALIRYSEDESPVDILKKLSVSNMTPEIRNFLENKDERIQVRYLETVFKNK